MTNKKFRHILYDPYPCAIFADDPLELSINELAAAAAVEIAQLSSASVSFGEFISEITNGGTDFFEWSRELGTVRETRTALSGLFGRFVARAYLEKYVHLKYFAPITNDTMSFQFGRNFSIQRKVSGNGDLPDWVGKTISNDLIIAEAKGSHNVQGYEPALRKAITQADRINIVYRGAAVRVKRYAIVTRWAITGHHYLSEPWLAVSDPEDGKPVDENGRKETEMAVSALHFSAMLGGMGYRDFSKSIRDNWFQENRSFELVADKILTVSGPNQPNPEPSLVAVLTAAGIIPLSPKEIMTAWRFAKRYRGQRVLLLSVPKSAYQGTVEHHPRSEDLSKEDTENDVAEGWGAPEESFWNSNIKYNDGCWISPLKDVELSRSPL